MKKHTMSVTLDRFQSLIGRKNVTETDTCFQIPNNLGGGSTLLLTCPKVLPADEPGCPVNPLAAIADLYGELAKSFGGEYKQTLLSVVPGTFADATEETPEHFAVSASGDMPPQALVLVEFPLDNPPQDVGLESDFARQHEAVYYHRVDQTDPDADYNASHGTDLWVMSMVSLGNFWQEIQRVWSARAAASELAFRRYAMNAPYYRDLFREYDFQVNVILRWKLVYGDERADLTILPGSENEDTVPIYYNQSGNKLLREALNTGLHMRMLDGLLGIIAM